MIHPRYKKITILLVFLILSGTLVYRRFDLQPQMNAVLIDENGSQKMAVTASRALKRGQIIKTEAGEYQLLKIGADYLVAIDERTTIELHSLSPARPVLRFTRGRLWIKNELNIPLILETEKTESLVSQTTASFINYDFKEMVIIAPIKGSIQTRLKDKNEYLLIPVPINVNEKTSSYSATTFDPTTGTAADFYRWINESKTSSQ